MQYLSEWPPGRRLTAHEHRTRFVSAEVREWLGFSVEPRSNMPVWVWEYDYEPSERRQTFEENILHVVERVVPSDDPLFVVVRLHTASTRETLMALPALEPLQRVASMHGHHEGARWFDLVASDLPRQVFAEPPFGVRLSVVWLRKNHVFESPSAGRTHEIHWS